MLSGKPIYQVTRLDLWFQKYRELEDEGFFHNSEYRANKQQLSPIDVSEVLRISASTYLDLFFFKPIGSM